MDADSKDYRIFAMFAGPVGAALVAATAVVIVIVLVKIIRCVRELALLPASPINVLAVARPCCRSCCRSDDVEDVRRLVAVRRSASSANTPSVAYIDVPQPLATAQLPPFDNSELYLYEDVDEDIYQPGLGRLAIDFGEDSAITKA